MADTPAHYVGGPYCRDFASVRRGLGLRAAYRSVPHSAIHLAVLLRDAELATGLRDPEALPHFHLDRAQRSDDLCCRLSVPCPTPSFRQPEILTPDLTWVKGAGQWKTSFFDFEGTHGFMWIKGWRCMNCSHTADPLIEANRRLHEMTGLVRSSDESVDENEHVYRRAPTVTRVAV